MSQSVQQSLLSRVVKAGSWTIFGNVVSQALRFGGNLLLTRLLFPEAFGLMAIGQSVLVGVHLLSDVGLSQSVVRSHRGHEPHFLDTIFTLQIFKGALVMLIMVVASDIAARGYSQPALRQLMPAMGLAAFIQGFSSTKVALINRKIEAQRLIFLELGSQLAGLLTMVGWAALWPSAWALVAGNFASTICMVLCSHLALKGHRNTFAFDKSVVREVWRFGGWVMISSAVTFFAGEGRNLINASLVTPKVIALMVLSSTLALIVWNVIQQVSGRVLFPAYSEVWRERPQNLPSVVERSRRIQLLGGCLVACIFALAGDRIIAAFYDPRYRAAGILLQIQAVGTIFMFLISSYTGVLWAIARPGVSTVLLAVQVAVMTALTYIGFWIGGPMGMICGAALMGLVMYPINALVFARFGLWQPRTDAIPIAVGLALAAYVYFFGAWAGVSL